MSDSVEFEEIIGIEEEFILNHLRPLVLLLGWVDHEGILSSLKSSNQQYKKKIINSLPSNWISISEIFDEFKVACIIAKITPPVISLISKPEYESIREELFSKIGEKPNQFFIYEDLLKGVQDQTFWGASKQHPTKETVLKAIEWMQSKKIKLIPYKYNAEVTVLAEAFLGDIERNLLFRIFVPSGRIWSNEADKFLELFRDYLAKVDKYTVRLDQRRTDYGVFYEFHGELPANGAELTSEFKNFSHFMDLCALDVDAARVLLTSKNLDEVEITKIISRYSKEARRLQLDIKQEEETKMLSIRHRLEAELYDLEPDLDDWNQIDTLLNKVIPRSQANALQSPFITTSGRVDGDVILNIRPQFINSINNIVAEEIYGNLHFTQEHHQIMDLIGKYGEEEQAELQTAIHQLADKGGTQSEKLRAGTRLKGFLIEVIKKTGDLGLGVLQSYIEKQLGL